MISEPLAEIHLEKIFSVIDKYKLNVSYFEVLFLLSLVHFSYEKVDFIVAEAGIGGEGDATNVVSPTVSVITNVALDHMVGERNVCTCACRPLLTR